MCSCNEGFRLDDSGVVCVDIDECFENPGICSVGQCINEEGRYFCQCPDGYMSLPGGSKFYNRISNLSFYDFIILTHHNV